MAREDHTAVERVLMARECSAVERSHTLPHFGSYTNGAHSFGMMVLAYELMPLVTRNLMLAIMVHDFPERWTGDMPAPAKQSDGEFGKRMAIIERRISIKMGWEIELTDDERFWLKALDRLELYCWAQDQIHMGNQNAVAVIGSLASWFMNNRVPQQVVDFLKDYKWTRTPEQLPK